MRSLRLTIQTITKINIKMNYETAAIAGDKKTRTYSRFNSGQNSIQYTEYGRRRVDTARRRS